MDLITLGTATKEDIRKTYAGMKKDQRQHEKRLALIKKLTEASQHLDMDEIKRIRTELDAL